MNFYADGLPITKTPDQWAEVGDLLFMLDTFSDYYAKGSVAEVERISRSETCSYEGVCGFAVGWARSVSPAEGEHQFCFYLDPNVAKTWRHLTGEELIRYANKT